MPSAESGSRVLIYSHDTFGLGHLRRCRAIAHDLVARHKNLSVLILSGSPIIGSFDFRARVDFVRIPGVIKLRNGEYTSLSLHLDIDETVALRQSIIEHTADVFDPDVFIVDKEPLGLRGEVEPTLKLLKARGTRIVLGVRDVLDEPAVLAPEWERKRSLPALEAFYDEIWVYGLPQIHEPLKGLNLSAAMRQRIVYTGYLPRPLPEHTSVAARPAITNEPFLLVTTGGGGDGEGLIDWVLSAYESGAAIPHPALLVLGPFMAAERQEEFFARAEALENVEAITFDSRIEYLLADAVGIVAMGGYNTFCEILTLDKRALIVPRTTPRLEQFIRADRARQLGLVEMLVDPLEGRMHTQGGPRRDPQQMADALARLPSQPRPSETVVPGLLDGFDSVNRLIEPWLGCRRMQPARLRAVASHGE
ncbi:MAG: hypothetical protein LPL00_03710 [Alphaproteobacteria bacterium]|nr:hypothetical protein [Alphaproteobacteria bacterium]MDX5368599.1 hypothetical protein [Alphaproteobacteria bacterium]MDX5463344.1 hypothetical protein [Alphaproteobacteria bacterium]